ncbi:hyaluronan mediated motility receptor [Aplysia californica]|uniref:Hyaluronan mediated motility receptor n=1 Tax=Aplysia californica TaxID=6500 RepID=A0ABM0JDY7_APLCA|nr:hyaluronan mediated motility receptor [Aplysia californica]
MAFPRAKLVRFNEANACTPGVGEYDVGRDPKHNEFKDPNRTVLDKTKAMAKLEASSKRLRDKGIIASVRGELSKHVEELHQRLRTAEEKLIDMEILKLGADKSRDMLQKDLSEKQTELSSLTNTVTELNQQKQQLEVCEADAVCLREKLALCLAEKEECEKKLTEAQKKIKVLEIERDSLVKEKGVLVEQMQQSEKMLEELKTQSEAANAEKQTFVVQQQDLCSQMKQFKEAHSKLQEKLFCFSAEKLEIQNQFIEFKQLNEKLESEKTVLIQNMEEVQRERDNAETEKLSLEEQLLENSSKVEELGLRMETVTSERENVMKERNELELKVNQSQEVCAGLEEQLSSLRGEKLAIEGRLSQLGEAHEQLTSERDGLLQKITEIESDRDSLIKERNELVTQREENASKMDDRISQLQAGADEEKTLLLGERDNLVHQLKMSEEQKSCLEEKLSCYLSAKQEIERDLEELREEEENLQRDLEEHKALSTSYQHQVAAMQDQIDSLEQCYTSLQEEMVMHTDKYEEIIEEQTSALQLQLDQINDEKEKLIVEVHTLEELKFCLEEEKRKLQDDMDKKVTDFSEQVEELKNKQIQSEARESAAFTEHKAEVEKLQEEHDQGRKQFQEDMEKRVAGLAEQIRELDSQKLEWETKEAATLSDHKAQVNKLREEHALQLNQLREDMEKKVTDSFEQIKELRSQKLESEARETAAVSNHRAELEKLKQEHSQQVVQAIEEQTKMFEEEKRKCLSEQEQRFQEKLTARLREKEICVRAELLQEFDSERTQQKRSHDEKVELMRKSFEDKLKLVESETTERCSRELQEKVKSDEELLQCFDDRVQEQEAQIERLLADKEQVENELNKLREYTEWERGDLNRIIAEMSDKIQEMEADSDAENEAESDAESWKAKYEDLVLRMEPFREILDGFEMERKLLQDRDKFTSEQIDRLTKECITNMGHQNHKQKVKYVNKLKQENVDLQKRCHETQEELCRQNALVKKYKERLDRLEGTTGKVMDGKKVKVPPKTPLKEGNR